MAPIKCESHVVVARFTLLNATLSPRITVKRASISPLAVTKPAALMSFFNSTAEIFVLALGLKILASVNSWVMASSKYAANVDFAERMGLPRMLIVSLFAAEPSALNGVVAVALAPEVLRACTWGMEMMYCGAGVEHPASNVITHSANATGGAVNRTVIKVSLIKL